MSYEPEFKLEDEPDYDQYQSKPARPENKMSCLTFCIIAIIVIIIAYQLFE
jgi:hypothetical protein